MRKHTIWISTILAMVLLLSSCRLFERENTAYTIYYTSFLSGTLTDTNKMGSTVKFKNVEQKDFSHVSRTESIINHKVETERSITVNGKSFPVFYQETWENSLISSRKYKKYGSYDSYRNGGVFAEIRGETNELIFFLNLDVNNKVPAGDMTEADAKQLAESVITSLYGTDTLQEYRYETTFCSQDEHRDEYTVLYIKYVWDIPTDEQINVTMNMNGEISCVNAKLLGLYSTAEKDLSKTDIENATQALQQSLPENWAIMDPSLILDSEGDYYIKAFVYDTKPTSEGIEGSTVYINVQ